MRVAWVLCLLLAACAGRTAPYAIERGGALPGEAYDSFERVVSGTAPVMVAGRGPGRPEPMWVYAFAPGFAPREAPLRVAAFKSAGGERAAAAATELAGRLGAALGDGAVFAPGATSAWQDTAPEFVLAGTVTRADEQVAGKEARPVTQVEAVLMRGGAAVGAMQVNLVQPAPGSVTALVGSGPEWGTRAEYAASAFKALFARAAGGAEEGVSAPAGDGQYVLRAEADGAP